MSEVTALQVSSLLTKDWEKIGANPEVRKNKDSITIHVETLASGAPVSVKLDVSGKEIPEIVEQLAVLFTTVRAHVLESAAKAEHVSTGGAMRWSKLPSTTRAMLVTAAARRLGL